MVPDRAGEGAGSTFAKGSEDNAPQRARGSASITVHSDGEITRLADLHQSGCARLRLPRTFADHVEAVAINTSGGLTGGDQLRWQGEVGAGASLTLTTQACERVYRSVGGSASAETRLIVAEGASLSWLPQETILYDGARLARSLHVEMAADAEALLLEPLVFGRTAMGESVRDLALADDWRVTRDGALVHAEAARLSGDAQSALDRAHVGDGARAFATLVLLSPKAEAKGADARTIIARGGAAKAAVALFEDRLAIRLAARDARALRTTLLPLIAALSPVGSVPRVWRI